MVDLVRKEGGEFLVNTRSGDLQLFQTIDALAGGGFVVAWLDQRRGMRAQQYDAAGIKVGGEVIVSSAEYQPGTVSGLASGGFVATWSEPDFRRGAIRGRVFDALGNPVGEEFAVQMYGANQVKVFDLPSGGFAVTWVGEGPGEGPANVRAQIFDAAGNKVGSEVLVTSAKAGGQTSPSGEALSSGGFVIAWTDRWGSDSPDGSVKGQRYDAAGNPIGDNFQINIVTEGLLVRPDVAALPNGGFVVAWRSYAGSYLAKAQIFDASGDKVGSEVVVRTPGADVDNVTVTALPWGGFLVAWENTTAGFPRETVRAQLFDGEGNPLGSQFQVNTNEVFADSVDSRPDFATLASGQVVGVWTNERGNGPEQVGVKAQIFTMPMVGTGRADTLDGGVGDDSLAGLAGYDVIFGGRGADAIEGNVGNDTIYGGGGNDGNDGGLGNDRLDGGIGRDMMAGGAGNDYYVVDSRGDVVVEHENSGIDTVDSRITHALARDLENLILSGREVIDGTGNALANVLTGNAAANSLSGGGGNDQLTGGAGVDTLTGGTGADVFRFGDGDTGRTADRADIITDFSRAQGDRIDLSAIDAIGGTAPVDRFTFIGSTAFSGTAGELRYAFAGQATIVSGDTDGNGTGDLFLQLTGRKALIAADFVLNNSLPASPQGDSFDGFAGRAHTPWADLTPHVCIV